MGGDYTIALKPPKLQETRTPFAEREYTFSTRKVK